MDKSNDNKNSSNNHSNNHSDPPRGTDTETAIMVEVYQPKKRRGIAGQRTTRVTRTPKPYWPGLEIDEHDRTKAGGCSGLVGAPKEGEGNSSPPGSVRGPTGGEIPERDAAGQKTVAHHDGPPSGVSAAPGKSGSAAGRFRKRKRRSDTRTGASEGNPPFPGHGGASRAGDGDGAEAGSRSGAEAAATDKPAAALGAGPGSAERETTPGPTEPAAGDPATTAPLHAGEEANPNHPSGDATGTTPKGSGGPKRTPASAGSRSTASEATSVVTPSKTTPRALVRFLLRKKFPVLADCVAYIRDVLSGMVSGSPALLQKHLTASETASLSSFGLPQNGSNNTSSNGSNQQQQQQQQAQHEALLGFEDICNRQEALLDRMAGLESALGKREEESPVPAPERESLESPRAAEAALRLELEEARASAASVKEFFRSRLEEQFRELEKRDALLRERERELEAARGENERLLARLGTRSRESSTPERQVRHRQTEGRGQLRRSPRSLARSGRSENPTGPRVAGPGGGTTSSVRERQVFHWQESWP
ncbi:unnamed protein product [Pseudo-nitzschia multistriata]|uniref:Uncharacterized protein n=1 Tax=Pseudo-nitzschia multistriata TaxID=183589 RepID=A0A448ZG85_9STRA|nr:unnamed protein product [Pseudo-nitzschia multistriata]